MSEKKEDIRKKELETFMDALLNGGIKIKQAAEVGKRCVDYTRGDEIIKWIMNNKAFVESNCPHNLDNKTISNEQDITPFASHLIEHGFIYRAQYIPLEGILDKSPTGTIKRPTWPKRLIKTSKQHFDATGFYIITYEGNQRWNHFMLFAIILGILAACMFQAWPLFLKVSVWYASVVLMFIMLTIIILRLILFVKLWFCGYDFWVFPNLFDEELGVVDSFKPLYSLIYRNDNFTMLCCRVVCGILSCASIYELSKTHGLKDVGNFAKQSFIDVLEWGHQKLIARMFIDILEYLLLAPEEQSIYKSIGVDMSAEFTAEGTGDDKDEEDEDDYRCLLGCGYNSLHQLMNKCMSKCDCMQELLDNKCLESCPQETIKVLTEARDDICRRAGIYPKA
ncbi:bifunctional Translocation protein Sec62/DEP domain [Babesia duncani]|uniref:Translocation protein SEC62 n=1 Tax=Babesia duncani TaxID=323732 RepID=A0AAD9PKR4_9APIC|nr:bifunctional Translocation protein Sec62/DEP domain [Babesia duncani]